MHCAGNRYDSSLGLLTKKFVQLVEAAPDGVLDLNKAAESLNVRPTLLFDKQKIKSTDSSRNTSPSHLSKRQVGMSCCASCEKQFTIMQVER